jgi:hypothetical protein
MSENVIPIVVCATFIGLLFFAFRPTGPTKRPSDPWAWEQFKEGIGGLIIFAISLVFFASINHWF